MRATALLLLFAVVRLGAELSGCACDVTRPETLEARECSLCKEAELQPPGSAVFFLQDSSPRKPNRWLALPRYHLPGAHPLSGMTPNQRLELWTAAIGK